MKRHRDVLVRIGMPLVTGRLIDEAPPGAHFLVSANAFWNKEKREFSHPVDRPEIEGLKELGLRPKQRKRKPGEPRPAEPSLWERLAYRTALDSAGFVAMHLYGGEYPWTVEQYVEFATAYPFDWYSAMDYCCEREIASDRATVRQRVALTAERFGDCDGYARFLRDDEGMNWIQTPVPIVQGWLADDYRECVDLLDEHMVDGWPELVGVGSVCRRQMTGPDGLGRILGALDSALPPHVKLHLFGVKSSALRQLAGHPRIESIDSCAWDYAARAQAYQQRKAEQEAGVPVEQQTVKSIAYRGKFMRDWAAKQAEVAKRPQFDLFG